MNAVFTNVTRQTLNNTHRLPPLRVQKNPALAAVIGFLFGPIGLGIYLGSALDALIVIGLFLVGTIFTIGFGAPVFWIACGVYGAVRVTTSNQNLEELERQRRALHEQAANRPPSIPPQQPQGHSVPDETHENVRGLPLQGEPPAASV